MPGVTRSRTISAIQTSILLLLLQSTFALAQIRLDLPAQALGDSLTAIGTLGHLNVMFDPSDVDGLQAPALKAELTADDALTRLLAGTHLHAVRVDANTISVVASPPQSPGTSPPGAAVTQRSTRLAFSGGKSSGPASLSGESTDEGSPGTSPGPRKKEETGSVALEQVVVTGTHIRGVAPAAPLLTITGDEIQKSGASTAGDILRDLPQSFSGGQQSTIGPNGAGPYSNGGNLNFSDSANLRGLGSDSTLVLINGIRLPVTGLQNSVDISNLPVAAIERIEIVTDGASAIYGSDAVGGVVNFVLKKGFDGAETSAEIGIPTDGGGLVQRYAQVFGRNWQSGSGFIAYQYRNQDSVQGKQRDWYTGPSPESVLPAIRQNSIYLSGQQRISADVRLFGQALYSHTTSFAVSTYPGTTTSDFLDTTGYTYGLAGGATIPLPGDWQLTTTGTYGRDHFDHLDSEPSTQYSAHDIPTNTLATGELSAEGLIAELPAGQVRAAVGSGYRAETFAYDGEVSASASRNVEHLYTELTIPVLGNNSSRSAPNSVTVTLAGRYEHYSDFGDHFSPQVGVSYRPINALKLRATWNNSYHAPSLYEQYGPQYAIILPVADSASASGSTNAIFRTSGNDKLRPETARSYTVGFDVHPAMEHDVRVSATYFHIVYDRRIAQPLTDFSAVPLDPAYTALVTLNPSTELQQSVLNAAGPNVYNYTGAPYNPTTVGAIIDDRWQNISSQRAAGMDLSASAGWESRFGRVDLYGNGTALTLHQKLTSASEEISTSGLIFYPSKFKARAGATWTAQPVSATGILNWSSASVDNLIVPSGHVASQTTIDLQFAYTAPEEASVVRGLSVRLSVLNAFNRSPPYAAGSYVGYDLTRSSPIGRVVKITAEKTW